VILKYDVDDDRPIAGTCAVDVSNLDKSIETGWWHYARLRAHVVIITELYVQKLFDFETCERKTYRI